MSQDQHEKNTGTPTPSEPSDETSSPPTKRSNTLAQITTRRAEFRVPKAVREGSRAKRHVDASIPTRKKLVLSPPKGSLNASIDAHKAKITSSSSLPSVSSPSPVLSAPPALDPPPPTTENTFSEQPFTLNNAWIPTSIATPESVDNDEFFKTPPTPEMADLGVELELPDEDDDELEHLNAPSEPETPLLLLTDDATQQPPVLLLTDEAPQQHNVMLLTEENPQQNHSENANLIDIYRQLDRQSQVIQELLQARSQPPKDQPPKENPTPSQDKPTYEDDVLFNPSVPMDWGTPGSTTQNPKEKHIDHRIDFFLSLMIDRGASDFHFHVGASPIFRQNGNIVPMRYRPIRPSDWERMIRPILPPGLWEQFAACGDVDFAYSIPGMARFRVNLMLQENGGGAVFRLIPNRIMTLEELGMPSQLIHLTELNRGLVLITGPTGSGKSTTLASLIDTINRRKAYHIITLEDPIEFVHSSKRSVVHQREIGTHSRDFTQALKEAVREDPDLILVGELRDQETIRLALEAAEKGVLVFGTLHTNSAAKTIDRVVNVFPVQEQYQIRSILAETLESVVSQQLLRRERGGRVAALEILFNTPGMGNIIRENKTQQLNSLIQTGQKSGMVAMDDSLAKLLKDRVISADAAMEKAIDKERFKGLMHSAL